MSREVLQPKTEEEAFELLSARRYNKPRPKEGFAPINIRHLKFYRKDLFGVDLEGVAFVDCFLSYCDFCEAKLKETWFYDCHLQFCMFNTAKLTNCTIVDSLFKTCLFHGTHANGLSVYNSRFAACNIGDIETNDPELKRLFRDLEQAEDVYRMVESRITRRGDWSVNQNNER